MSPDQIAIRKTRNYARAVRAVLLSIDALEAAILTAADAADAEHDNTEGNNWRQHRVNLTLMFGNASVSFDDYRHLLSHLSDPRTGEEIEEQDVPEKI